MKRVFKLLLAASCISIASAALADNNTVSPEKGFYIGGNLGGGTAKCSACSLNLTSATVTSTSNNGGVVNVFGGYQINRYFAAEVGVGALPQMTYNLVVNDATLGNITYTRNMASAHAYAALKAMLPIKQFSLFGKFGFDSQRLSYNEPITDDYVSNTASGTFMALGAGYSFTPNWTGTASYNQVLTSNSGIDYTSRYVALGFTYLIF
jgi:opacity protein-like surface antigen